MKGRRLIPATCSQYAQMFEGMLTSTYSYRIHANRLNTRYTATCSWFKPTLSRAARISAGFGITICQLAQQTCASFGRSVAPTVAWLALDRGDVQVQTLRR